jgi:hypothetical protein
MYRKGSRWRTASPLLQFLQRFGALLAEDKDARTRTKWKLRQGWPPSSGAVELIEGCAN